MNVRDIAAVIAVTAVWGIAFVGIKEVLADAPALTAAGMRFLLGGLLLVPFVRRARGSDRPVGRAPRFMEMAAVGLLQTTLLYGLGFLGVQRVTAGASALLLNTNPVLVAVLAVPLLRDRLRMTAVTGLALAVAGVALISVRSGLGTPSGVVLLLLGAVSWACGSILIKRLSGVDLLRLNCGQMLLGGVPLLVAGLVAEHRLPRLHVDSVLWFVFLVVVATSVNFVVWFRLLERHGAVAVTSWLFLIPVFGVLSGWLLLHEPVGWRLLVGGAFVVAGVLLAQDRGARAGTVVDAPG